jgi:L-asparaginase II
MSGFRVEVTRAGTVESVHEIDLAVATAGGETALRIGETGHPVFTRSAIKPFQALPLLVDGAADRLGMTEPELALCCSSHSGQPEHVALARSILERAGVDQTALACGPHAPLHGGAAEALREKGEAPGRLHNNCSGKHAGMLALAVARGWPVAGYHRPDHPVQARVAAELARWARVAEADMPRGVDGCGVVTFALPLNAVAAAMARLVAASTAWDPTARDAARDAAGDGAGDAGASGERSSGADRLAAGRLIGAMRRHPFLVGGSDRLCTRLTEVTAGRVVAKVGAEGVYVAASLEDGRALALKVRDGARRAAETGLLGALAALDLVSAGELEALARWWRPVVLNTRGEMVGEVRAVVELGGGNG